MKLIGGYVFKDRARGDCGKYGKKHSLKVACGCVEQGKKWRSHQSFTLLL